MTDRFKDGLILCNHCKRYLSKENFQEYNLKKCNYSCRECFKKELRAYNIKTGKYKGTNRTDEEVQKKEQELLKDPYEEINLTIENLVRGRGDYKHKEDNLCGYCASQSTVVMDGKKYCWKHWLIQALSMGKPFLKNIKCNSPELERKLKILEELGIEIGGWNHP